MRNLALAWLVTSTLLVMAKSSSANDELEILSSNPSNWAMQADDFVNHRYNELNNKIIMCIA
jgi:hypothetical protein